MKINRTLLEKYNKQGPRYTSYPPANFFHENFTSQNLIQGIEDSNSLEPNISLYVHIPFCPRLCHFCGCNTVIGRDEDIISRYLKALKEEIKLYLPHLDKNRKVTQVHWGGGTPNSLKIKEIEDIMSLIYQNFTLADEHEIAMECSPAYLEFEDIDALAKMGFNRLSLGIQDFNEHILEIINRLPAKHPIEKIIGQIRKNNFKSVNLDLVYGLPEQNLKSFEQNIEKAINLNPDRLVTFSYAHVPWVKKAQKQLESYTFPTADEKFSMLETAYNKLSNAGYTPIGIDHFAKPEDELSVALKTKQLHRNFQGYCTKATTGPVYAFGSSSISQLHDMYSQNTKGVVNYTKTIEEGKLPIEKGYILNQEEKIIRHWINSIMCNNFANIEETASSLDISIDDVKKVINLDKVSAELITLKEDGLVKLSDAQIEVTETGRFFARNIAMEFDSKWLQKAQQYSKTI